MIKRSLRFYLIFVFLIISLQSVNSLSYDEIVNIVADVFGGLIDKNEGSTTFRSLYIPMGGRAEALGSAFTGLANDLSFLEYNPAASSVLKISQAGLFHNAWISDASIDGIAYTIRKNNLGFGASLKCLYVPFPETNIFGETVASSYYSETITTFNISYNFFPGYDFKGLAVGANIKLGYRGMPDYTDNSTNEIIVGSGLSQSGLAVMGDLGIQLRFNALKFYSSREPNIHIGLAANNLGASFTNLGVSTGVILDDPLPSNVAIGFSYKPFKPLTFTLEYKQPVNLQDISQSELFHAGTGFIVQITDFFAIQGGFLLKGASPRVSLGAEFQVKSYLFNLNYTFDQTSSVNPVNRISLNVKVDLGDSGRFFLQRKIDKLYADGLAAYTVGKMDEAIAIWTEVLELDPGFDPAIKAIESAKYSMALREKIINVQTLD